MDVHAAKPNGAQRVRPWLVLVVVDSEKSRCPGSIRAPLPSIKVAAAFKATELPDSANRGCGRTRRRFPMRGPPIPQCLPGK